MSSLTRRMGPALEAHYRFITWLTPALTHIPRQQKFLLGDRIQTTALDVLERLLEATYSRDRRQPLRDANLGIEKLRFFCRMTYDLQFWDQKKYEHAARTLDEVGRFIGGWAKSDNLASRPDEARHGQAA